MTDLYKEAARIVQRANLREGSLKTLVYSSSYRNLRQLFALVTESIKYHSILKDILGHCGSSLLNEEIIDNDHDMAIVLLYELLVGNGFGRAGHYRKIMRQYKAEIKAAHDAILKEHDAASLTDILKGKSVETKAIPRYARINLLKCTVQEAIDKVSGEGWEYLGQLNIDRFQEDVTSLSEGQFSLDPLLDDVLIFPINTDLHNHALVMDGILILQDRASCVPARVLNPVPGSVVLDCCAAPGNKTSHLASLMRDQGRIIALDRDAKRMTTMKTLLQRSGASCVEMIVQDFLTLSPEIEEASDVTMILVDPSCSGSGMPGRSLSAADQDVNHHRLQTLKCFQISLLKHALRFSSVQRVVYSTCSIHQQENEEVVEEVMSHVNRYFKFVPVLPEWPDSRGLEQFENHKNFLRISQERHLTTGFFIACFERRKESVKSDSKNLQEKNGIQGHDESDNKCLEVNNKIGSKMSDEDNEHDSEVNIESASSSSKRKKRKNKQTEDQDDGVNEVKSSSKKKKGDKKKEDVIVLDESLSEDTQTLDKKVKKKKKQQKETDQDMTESVDRSSFDDGICSEKKKKRKKERDDCKETKFSEEEPSYIEIMEYSSKKKKKQKQISSDNGEGKNVLDKSSNTEDGTNNSKKKKKKKRAHEESDEDATDHFIKSQEEKSEVRIGEEFVEKTLKKSKHTKVNVEKDDNDMVEEPSKMKKRRKKSKEGKSSLLEEPVGDVECCNTDENGSKKKKKKKH